MQPHIMSKSRVIQLFLSLIESVENIIPTIFTTEPMIEGMNYWRVRAKNALDEYGEFSSYRSIDIDTTPPPIPNLTAPADGASIRPYGSFIWDNPPTAVQTIFGYGTSNDPTGSPETVLLYCSSTRFIL